MEAVGQENNKDLYLRECDGKASQLWHFDNVSSVDQAYERDCIVITVLVHLCFCKDLISSLLFVNLHNLTRLNYS